MLLNDSTTTRAACQAGEGSHGGLGPGEAAAAVAVVGAAALGGHPSVASSSTRHSSYLPGQLNSRLEFLKHRGGRRRRGRRGRRQRQRDRRGRRVDDDLPGCRYGELRRPRLRRDPVESAEGVHLARCRRRQRRRQRRSPECHQVDPRGVGLPAKGRGPAGDRHPARLHHGEARGLRDRHRKCPPVRFLPRRHGFRRQGDGRQQGDVEPVCAGRRIIAR